MFCASNSIAKLPGCVQLMSSSTASLMALGIAIRLSIHIHPSFTLITRLYEWIYGLISFKRSLSLRMTQFCTSFKIASFLVKVAYFLLKILLLKILLIVSVIQRCSAVSITLVHGVVSLLDEVFLAGVLLEGELLATRTCLGVDLVD